VVNVYSTTKGITALCAHQLAEQGQLDWDAPVARYWHQFALEGKAHVPVRWLLSHRAGIPAVSRPLPPEALYDWDAMTAAVAAQKPWWEPGERHGYHAFTYGLLVGELVRRISGRTLGNYFREEIAEPLDLDFHIGLADKEHGRTADMVVSNPPQLVQAIRANPVGIVARAFANPPSLAFGPNVSEWRRAEIPAANGHGTARALARLYGALAVGGVLDGVRVLRPESIHSCYTEQSCGQDAVLGVPTRFSLGFMLLQPDVSGRIRGLNPRTFGHSGAGGSLGFADPDARLGFGYVMNRMGTSLLLDPRALALIDATYAALN
jgi:CubicO group peptidase (beta-lactamase class C family)